MKFICKCGRSSLEKTCPMCSKKGMDTKALYRTAAWKRMAKRRIGEFPICECCHIRQSEQTHHRRKTADNPDMFFIYDNLEALCRQCHLEKDKK